MVCLSLLTTKKRRHKGLLIYNYILPKIQDFLLLDNEASQLRNIRLNHSLIVQKIYHYFPDYLSSSAKYVMKMIENLSRIMTLVIDKAVGEISKKNRDELINSKSLTSIILYITLNGRVLYNT